MNRILKLRIGVLSDRDLIKQWNSLPREKGAQKIPDNFTIWRGSVKGKDGALKNRLCYSNSLEYVNNNKGTQLAVGLNITKKEWSRAFAVEPDDYGIDSTLHAWVIQDGKVIDPTLGKSSDIFVGKIIDTKGLKDGSDIRDVLFELLGR